MRIATKLSLVLSVACLSQISIRTATAADPEVLVSGAAVGPVSGASGSMAYYKLTVASGATAATFVTSGGPGDCDLYVKFGALPTRTVWPATPTVIP